MGLPTSSAAPVTAREERDIAARRAAPGAGQGRALGSGARVGGAMREVGAA
jgi:hypothetical protein